MMTRILTLLAALLVLAWPPMATAQDGPLRIEITEGVIEPLPFAVPDFVAGDAASAEMSRNIARVIAADLVGTGVTACAVSPGATDSQMLQATADLYDVTPAELASHQLIRRLIDPAEIAAAIAFCASPAGSVVNGSVLHADGGFAP